MNSILERLGTDEFPRLRLGVGRPPGQMLAPDYVLQDFSRDELSIVNETLDRACEAAITFVINGLEVSMNKYNGSLP
jgi:PTH1 family peptidyl-tRNA hydrolase